MQRRFYASVSLGIRTLATVGLSSTLAHHTIPFISPKVLVGFVQLSLSRRLYDGTRHEILNLSDRVTCLAVLHLVPPPFSLLWILAPYMVIARLPGALCINRGHGLSVCQRRATIIFDGSTTAPIRGQTFITTINRSQSTTYRPKKGGTGRQRTT